MKKLVKPFKNEEEIQVANALCGEYQGCFEAICTVLTYPDGAVCEMAYNDDEQENDILF